MPGVWVDGCHQEDLSWCNPKLEIWTDAIYYLDVDVEFDTLYTIDIIQFKHIGKVIVNDYCQSLFFLNSLFFFKIVHQ